MGQPHSTAAAQRSEGAASGEGTSAGAAHRSESTIPARSPPHLVDGRSITAPAQRSEGTAPARSTRLRLFRNALFFSRRKGKGRFEDNYVLGREIGRGRYGRTYTATAKKGDIKGQTVAVKILSKYKMSAEADMTIKDVRREAKLLKALSGHTNFLKFHDEFEDATNVYIITQLCEGGELYHRIKSRGGRYTEEDAKVAVVQILNAVAFCHLQGVVHCDLKPENVLYTTRDENATMKIIDFGLSSYIRPDERLTVSTGTLYYAAPEVLNRSYSTQADIWSIGVITYVLLCGVFPFGGKTYLEIKRSVEETKPNFTHPRWSEVSPEAKAFVKRLMKKDYRKRMTAAQALTHPWLRDERRQVPLDILIYKLVKSYLLATPLRHSALKALSKALPETELVYIRSQFQLLIPDEEGRVSFEQFQMALMQNATEAMEESRVHHILSELEHLLSDTKMDFREFCAATISPHQLRALEEWKIITRNAFMYFEGEGNRAVSANELAQEMNVNPGEFDFGPWVRSNGYLNITGYIKYLHGVTRYIAQTQDRIDIQLQFVYYLICIQCSSWLKHEMSLIFSSQFVVYITLFYSYSHHSLYIICFVLLPFNLRLRNAKSSLIFSLQFVVYYWLL